MRQEDAQQEMESPLLLLSYQHLGNLCTELASDGHIGSPLGTPRRGRLMLHCQPSRLRQSETLLERNKMKCGGEEQGHLQ